MTQDQETEFTIDFGRMALRCLEHKVLAFGIAIAITVGVAIFMMLKPNIYSCKSKLICQAAGSSYSSNISALVSLAGMDAGNASNDPSLYLEDILFSNNMLSGVINQKWPKSEKKDHSSSMLLLSDMWSVHQDTTKHEWRALLNADLTKRLVTGRYIVLGKDKKSGVFSLTTNFEDPMVSFEVNRFLIDQINDILVKRLRTTAKTNREFLETRTSEAKKELEKSEVLLQTFVGNNRARFSPELQVEEGRLQRNLEVNQAIYLQLIKQLEMSKIEEAKDLPVVNVIDSPIKPVRKSGPKRTLAVLIASVVGVVVGLSVACIYDLIQTKIGPFLKGFISGARLRV